MTDGIDIRERCCWKRCRDLSAIIYYGAGLCDEHWHHACSVYLPLLDFLLPRVIPEAAEVMREQDRSNKAQDMHREAVLKAKSSSVQDAMEKVRSLAAKLRGDHAPAAEPAVPAPEPVLDPMEKLRALAAKLKNPQNTQAVG